MYRSHEGRKGWRGGGVGNKSPAIQLLAASWVFHEHQVRGFKLLLDAL